MQAIWHYDSPLGGMTMAGDAAGLSALWFDSPAYLTPESETAVRLLPVFEETVCWLDTYFSGIAPNFTPPLRPLGTPFRQAVWKILLEIPYGATTTYGQLAARIARERSESHPQAAMPTPFRMSAQAVGGAVGHNPIALIIPCHRVIGADGSLTGYAAGLDRKSWLLRHEQLAKRR